MPRILEDFARGDMAINLPPAPNSERADAMRIANNLENKLLARLSGENKAIFEKFVKTNLEIIELTAIENRIHGYGLGVMMTAEVFVTAGPDA